MNLLIRTDANFNIGMGHAMRCLALAQAWRSDKRSVIFVMNNPLKVIKDRLQDAGMRLIETTEEPGSSRDAERVLKLISKENIMFLTIDGYHFDSSYQKYLSQEEYISMIIDDNSHLEKYYADILLNQNNYAVPKLYDSKIARAKLLLGSKYAMLRKEFNNWQNHRKAIHHKAKNILITLGGSKTKNTTIKIIKALEAISRFDIEVDLIFGRNDPVYEQIANILRYSRLSVNLHQHIKDISVLMARADIAISTGGTTCWELAFMGIPCILLILSDNQKQNAESLCSKGCAINLGRSDEISTDLIAETALNLLNSYDHRLRMSRIAHKLVDGYGSRRVKSALIERNLKIRPVTTEDCTVIWKWRNDPDVRMASFSSEPIIWEDHLSWFESRMQKNDCKMFVAHLKNGTTVGQIRYDIKASEAEVSIVIAPNYRDLGIGSSLLRLAVKEIFKNARVKRVNAFVKKYNISSRKAFENAGFKNSGIKKVRGSEAAHFIVRRETHANFNDRNW